MKAFYILTADKIKIRFRVYWKEAPQTAEAFLDKLPYTEVYYHAKVSGEEIWTDKAPELSIIQENASVFAQPGEVVIGPLLPKRNKINACMGIFYGQGQLLDCGNIFAKVFPEDMDKLILVGKQFWEKGFQKLAFKPLT